MILATNRDGTVRIGCQSSSTTTLLAANPTPVQILTAYQSIATFTECQSDLQQALDNLFDANFDLKAFIRTGSSTSVTAAGVGTFLATICNNYRLLRASIAAATNLSQLNAISIISGWPGNP